MASPRGQPRRIKNAPKKWQEIESKLLHCTLEHTLDDVNVAEPRRELPDGYRRQTASYTNPY